jgi:hypothetical protein
MNNESAPRICKSLDDDAVDESAVEDTPVKGLSDVYNNLGIPSHLKHITTAPKKLE